MTTNLCIFRRAHLRKLGQCNTSFRCIRSLLTKSNDTIKNTDSVKTQIRKQLETGDSVSVKKLITVEDVDKFCDLTGDFNTIHTQSRIVHGALLNGLVSGVIGTILPGPGTMVVSQTLKYPQSCVAPQNVTVTVSITSARKIVCCDFNCCTADGVIVLHGDAKLIMSFRVHGSTQSSITLDWEGVSDVEDVQYKLQMKDRIKNWITVYLGCKTRRTVEDLYPGEAYKFKLSLRTEDGLHGSTHYTAFATKEEQQSLAHLHRAIKTGNFTKAQKFLKMKGQAVDALDQWGRSALMVSAWHGNGELVDLLLANGADVNLPSWELGQTTLMIACSRGDVDIVQQLTERGASWDAKDKNGCTALTYAVDASQMECLEIALEARADIETRDKLGWTPLMRAVMLECSLPIINKLIDHGAQVSSHDDRNVTCLMLAVLSDRSDVVQMLLHRGADVTVKDVYGNTARDMATTKQTQEIIALLKDVAIEEKTVSKFRAVSRGVSTATSHREVMVSIPSISLAELISGSPSTSHT